MKYTIKHGKPYHKIFCDEVCVGDAWKFPRKSAFGVRLFGVYWRNGKPNRRCGRSCTVVPRLKDVPDFLEKAMQP